MRTFEDLHALMHRLRHLTLTLTEYWSHLLLTHINVLVSNCTTFQLPRLPIHRNLESNPPERL